MLGKRHNPHRVLPENCGNLPLAKKPKLDSGEATDREETAPTLTQSKCITPVTAIQ